MYLSHIEAIVTVLAFILVLITSIGSYRLGLKQMAVSRELSKQQIEASLEAAKRQWEVQLIVAKHQIIAPMRQAWINKLRKRLSTFIALSVLVRGHFDANEVAGSEMARELLELQEEIILLLHRSEPDHDTIGREVATITSIACTGIGNVAEMANSAARLSEIAQKVLKDEWQVTKKMERDTLAL